MGACVYGAMPGWVALARKRWLSVPVAVFPGYGYGVFDVGQDAAGRRAGSALLHDEI